MMFGKRAAGLAMWLLPLAAAAASLTYAARPDDFLQLRCYRLDNGAQVMVLPNYAREEISYAIVFDVGSADDPPGLAGTAHFVEHMLAKGTDRLGTTGYAEEKPLLDKIDEQYALYTTAPEADRPEIYRKIDELSVQASHHMISNEFYDGMRSLGASAPNAVTSTRFTSFFETVPVISFERAMTMEAERFSHPVFRGFRTEQDVIRAEQRMLVDNMSRQLSVALNRHIFGKDSPYTAEDIGGSADTVGRMTPAGLMRFYRAHYVPENMTIWVVGPIEAADALRVVERAFGTLPRGTVIPRSVERFKAFDSPQTVKIDVPNGEVNAILVWRLPGLSTRGMMVADAAASLLGSPVSKAQRLVSSGRISKISCGIVPDAKYGNSYVGISATGVPGTDPRELAALLETEIAALKAGDFDPALIGADIDHGILFLLDKIETGDNVAFPLSSFFATTGMSAETMNDSCRIERKLTPGEIIEFCNKYLNENHLTLLQYNRLERKEPTVEMPDGSSPLECPPGVSSSFFTAVTRMPDFKPQLRLEIPERKIARFELRLADGREIPLAAVENTGNSFYRLQLVFEAGSLSNPRLPLAIRLFQGTERRFFLCGAMVSGDCTAFRTTITLDGMYASQAVAVAELSRLLTDPKATDNDMLKQALAQIESDRRKLCNNQLNRINGLVQRLTMGRNSPLLLAAPLSKLAEITPEQAGDTLVELAANHCRAYYYGPPGGADELRRWLALPPLKASTARIPKEIPRPRPRLYFYPHESLDQNHVLLVRFGAPAALDTEPLRRWFSRYYNALVWLEIREKRGLCYYVNAYIDLPEIPNNSSVFAVEMLTSPEKTAEVVNAVRAMGLPEDPELAAKTRDALIREWRGGAGGTRLLDLAQELELYGFPPDSPDIWADRLSSASFEDLRRFYESQAAGCDAIMVVGRQGFPKIAGFEKMFRVYDDDLFAE